MKNINKLLGAIIIALLTISSSCEKDNDNPTPPVIKYPIILETSFMLPCGCVTRFDNVNLDSVYIINDTANYSRYCKHENDCFTDFSKNSILVLYSWCYGVTYPHPPVLTDTLWKLSDNEYHWDIGLTEPATDTLLGRASYSISLLLPKIPKDAKFTVNIRR